MAGKWQTATIVAFMILSGCAVSKEARVKAALTDAGVPEKPAACMATIMAEDLTTAQLRSLQKAADTVTNPYTMSLNDAIAVLKRVNDPALLGTLVRAGTRCLIGL
jgi:hypothetical protein